MACIVQDIVKLIKHAKFSELKLSNGAFMKKDIL